MPSVSPDSVVRRSPESGEPNAGAPSGSALQRLSEKAGQEWPHIFDAQRASQEKLDLFAKLVGETLLPQGDASLVVFGSLGRREVTRKSDLDWALLIDGRADSKHLQIAQEIERLAGQLGMERAGPTGVFGGLVFSHPLVHEIGGQEDTNHNLTRRQLLILESKAIAVSSSVDVRRGILRKVLDRYVLEDASFPDDARVGDRIPRFLLNDVIRLWRTMAVDYANKFRARRTEGWALRNIKLRMSRKLLFVSGVLMCLSWRFRESPTGDTEALKKDLVLHLEQFVERPPLESVAQAVERFAPEPELALNIFGCYDEFLAMLNDDMRREHLQELTPEDSANDGAFREARRISEAFDQSLRTLLFESDSTLTDLVHHYGFF